MILIVLLVYASVLWVDFRRVRKNGRPREIWPYLILFAAALVAQSLHEFNIEVPSPAPPISGVVRSLFNLK